MAIKLPITEKEFETIINTLKGPHPALYAKLWSHKMNYLNIQLCIKLICMFLFSYKVKVIFKKIVF